MPYKNKEDYNTYMRNYMREYQRRLREIARTQGIKIGPHCRKEAQAHLEDLRALRKHPSLLETKKK